MTDVAFFDGDEPRRGGDYSKSRCKVFIQDMYLRGAGEVLRLLFIGKEMPDDIAGVRRRGGPRTQKNPLKPRRIL
jgi:hypothetical protein